MTKRLLMLITAAAALPALALLGPAGTAAAADGETAPTRAQEFFAQFPEAPADCHIYWDPVEDAIEAHVTEDQVPAWADEWFDAFDDWCEGDND